MQPPNVSRCGSAPDSARWASTSQHWIQLFTDSRIGVRLYGRQYGDRSALGGVESSRHQRREDVLRRRRPVPHLDREVRALDAAQHAAGDVQVVRDDRVAVEVDAVREGLPRRGVAADPRVAVEGDGADGGGAGLPGRQQTRAHGAGAAHPHPGLHDEAAGPPGQRHEAAERAGRRLDPHDPAGAADVNGHDACPGNERAYERNDSIPAASWKTASNPAASSAPE